MYYDSITVIVTIYRHNGVGHGNMEDTEMIEIG